MPAILYIVISTCLLTGCHAVFVTKLPIDETKQSSSPQQVITAKDPLVEQNTKDRTISAHTFPLPPRPTLIMSTQSSLSSSTSTPSPNTQNTLSHPIATTDQSSITPPPPLNNKELKTVTPNSSLTQNPHLVEPVSSSMPIKQDNTPTSPSNTSATSHAALPAPSTTDEKIREDYDEFRLPDEPQLSSPSPSSSVTDIKKAPKST